MYPSEIAADLDDVADFAAKLPLTFLQCRERGHNWTDWAASKEDGYYARGLRCSRCHTIKWQTLSLTGSILTTRYEYAENYTTHGMGRIMGEGRDLLRLESLTRTFDISPN